MEKCSKEERGKVRESFERNRRYQFEGSEEREGCRKKTGEKDTSNNRGNSDRTTGEDVAMATSVQLSPPFVK